MKRAGLIAAAAVFLLCLVVVLIKNSAGDPQARQESLETAIPEAIRLLDAGEYELFLRRYIPPEKLQELEAKGGFAPFVKGLEEVKGSYLPALLRQAQEQKTPPLQNNKPIVEYRIDAKKLGEKGPSHLRFRKIDKYWYIDN